MTSEPITLPDDPRGCCKAISAALEPLDDWPIGALPEDFPGLVRALCEGDYLGDASGGLNAFADQARDSGRAYRAAFRRIAELAGHGARDHRQREVDKRTAEGKPAYGGPTWGEVKAAQRALASVGKAVSDKEAVELLGDEGEADAA
ncbi:MAG: hypothetical protein IID49_05450 [Proteobacteria bacterium]|nr:hypothetical protein [Pseudomonadota bacterium]